MPWTLRKQPGGKVAIVKKTTGEIVGHSDSRAMGLKAIAARYAAESGAKMKNK